MSDYEIFEIANVVLQKGGFLPTVRLAYKTLGSGRRIGVSSRRGATTPFWCRPGTPARTTTTRPI